MLNSDTQEYIPRIQDFTKNFLFLCVIASTLFSFLFSSYGKFINLNAIIHFERFTGFHSFTDFLHKIMCSLTTNFITLRQQYPSSHFMEEAVQKVFKSTTSASPPFKRKSASWRSGVCVKGEC